MNAISLTRSSVEAALMAPALWFGRKVSQIFTEPLPEKNKAWEIANRMITFAALATLAASLVFFLPLAVAGWASKQVRPAPQLPAAEERNEEVLRKACQEINRLKTLYEAICNLKSSELPDLSNRLSTFKKQYFAYRDLQGNETTFQLFDQLETNVEGMQKALDFYVGVKAQKDTVAVPRDGNCWLHTALIGLEHLNHPKRRDLTHQTLRTQVIDWLEGHQQDPKVQDLLPEALQSHKEHLREQLTAEQVSLNQLIETRSLDQEEEEAARARIESVEKTLTTLEDISTRDYFASMRKVGAHGSQLELYAIAQMFQVNIAVWREIKNPSLRLTKVDEQFILDPSYQTINIVLTIEQNHFNYLLPQE